MWADRWQFIFILKGFIASMNSLFRMEAAMKDRVLQSLNRRRFFQIGMASIAMGSTSFAEQKQARESEQNAISSDVALMHDYAKAIKPIIFRNPSGILRFRYLTAGVKSYPYLVDWDAVWGGMSYLIDGDPDPLRESLLNLLDHVQPNGKGERVIQPNMYGAPSFTNRPFLAMGSFILTRELGSAAWMPEWAWERLNSLLMYWHVNRTGRHGLLKWLHVDEGLSDNGPANWTWDNNTVEATDLNAQMLIEHCAAAYIAQVRGDEIAAKQHQQYAKDLHSRLEASLWSSEDHFYYSSYNSVEREMLPVPIRCFHSTNLWPLWTGVASTDRAHQVITEYILSQQHFWSEHGVRSMSAADPRYNNGAHGVNLPASYPNATGPVAICSNWQGPVWSITNYLAALCLKRYGFPHQADEVAAKIIRVHAKSLRQDGHMSENYDADTGKALGAEGGLASWALMLRHLPSHLKSDEPWIFRGLDIPT
jgi:hypothetical protein